MFGQCNSAAHDSQEQQRLDKSSRAEKTFIIDVLQSVRAQVVFFDLIANLYLMVSGGASRREVGGQGYIGVRGRSPRKIFWGHAL